MLAVIVLNAFLKYFTKIKVDTILFLFDHGIKMRNLVTLSKIVIKFNGKNLINICLK